MVKEFIQRGGCASSGFPGADKTEPHFLVTDPLHLTGFTLYYNGCAGQLAVLEVEKSIKERGMHIAIVAKNISDMTARDFVLAGASVNLIDLNPRPIRLYNLVMDGMLVHAVLRSPAGYGQVLDLKREEAEARKKGGKGCSTVYVLGDFGSSVIARKNSNGIPYKAGKSKRDDIIEAGGLPIDREMFKRHGSGSKILAYALEG